MCQSRINCKSFSLLLYQREAGNSQVLPRTTPLSNQQPGLPLPSSHRIQMDPVVVISNPCGCLLNVTSLKPISYTSLVYTRIQQDLEKLWYVQLLLYLQHHLLHLPSDLNTCRVASIASALYQLLVLYLAGFSGLVLDAIANAFWL